MKFSGVSDLLEVKFYVFQLTLLVIVTTVLPVMALTITSAFNLVFVRLLIESG